MKLSFLDRLCGRTKEDVKKREQEDSERQASRIGRAILKAISAIKEAKLRKQTDTVFLEMKADTSIASGIFKGALGLSNEELGLLPKPLLDEVLAVAGA